MFTLPHLKEAYRIFKRARAVNKQGFTKYSGNAAEVCEKIIKKCYNGRFFQTSLGHFSQFYTRDFGFCAESLVNLGYKQEVKKTLKYALSIFSRHNVIATTITPDEKPIHIFDYSPDSLPLLLRTIRVSNSKDLLKEYSVFLESKTMEYFNEVFDTKRGLVRKDKIFSSIKDNAKRISSCYDNCMLAMLSDELNKLKLNNPFKDFKIKENIKKNFWQGKYFLDDLSGKDYITGDAQVYPFWCGVFSDKEIFNQANWSIQSIGLDTPVPLKYTIDDKNTKLIFPLNLILGDYETNTIWLHLGLCYLDVISKFEKDQLEIYMDKFKDIIEKHQTFPEILEPDASIYKRFHYVSDEGMLWAAKFLNLK
ncbi:MAG: hypothetical protein ACOCQG_05910 [Candidatus Nanoarchaeia archaeon]